MRIGIDLSWMSAANQCGGIFQYGMRLISALTKYTEHHIVAIANADCESLFVDLKDFSNFTIVNNDNSFLLRRLVEEHKLEIIHAPIQHYISYTLAVPMICTLHDLQHYYYPEFFTPEEINCREIYYKKSAKFSERVIVTYDHVKDDLVRFYGIGSEKIDVCGHGMSEPEDVSADQIKLIKTKYNIPTYYLFYSANTWRHKNHIGLLNGLKILHEKHNIKMPLICTGLQYPDFFPQIEEEVRKLDLTEYVKFLGYLPEEDIPVLLAGATLAVVPTLYEAGSFPLIEAMNLGVPVICASTTSLPSTIGDERFVFDPTSPEEMAEKMAMILKNNEIRQENITNSLERVKEWRWENRVQKYCEAYRTAIQSFNESKKNDVLIDWSENYEFFVTDKLNPLIDELHYLRQRGADCAAKKDFCGEEHPFLKKIFSPLLSSIRRAASRVLHPILRAFNSLSPKAKL